MSTATAAAAANNANKLLECFIPSAALAWLTYQQEPQCRYLIAITTTTHAFLYTVLRLTSILQPSKGSLSYADEAEWRSRVLGTINAVLLCVGSILCFLEWPYEPTVEGWTGPDRVWSNPCLFASFFVGYLQWDLCWLIWHWREHNDPSAAIHHVLFIAVTHHVLRGYFFKRPFAWLSLTELSTPFLNARWFYAASKMKEERGKQYYLSSLLFAITFLTTRVLGYTLGLLDMLMSYSEWKSHRGLHGVALGLILGYCLNLFWSLKVAQALQRAMKKGNGKSKRN